MRSVKRKTATPQRRTRRRSGRIERLGLARLRLQRGGKHRMLLVGGGAICGLAALLGGIYLVSGADIQSRVGAALRGAVVDASLGAGLRVKEVFVAGRKEASRRRLLDALRIKVGDPILTFDPAAARERLLDIGWIADARVERRLPDTVMVTLTERKPIAIWQRNNHFTLVDRDGNVIGHDGLDRYRHLKIIVGKDAPKHAATLLSMLRLEPDLVRRVTHAIRIGGRRWDLRLSDAINIQLPAKDAEAAWRKLTTLEKEFGLLGKDINTVDLRIPGQMSVRVNRKPDHPKLTGNQT